MTVSLKSKQLLIWFRITVLFLKGLTLLLCVQSWHCTKSSAPDGTDTVESTPQEPTKAQNTLLITSEFMCSAYRSSRSSKCVQAL